MKNQLSHNALTIYLRNLRTLEYIKYQCEESVKKINDTKKHLEYQRNSLTLPRVYVYKPKYFDMDDFGGYLGFLVLDLIILGVSAIFGILIIIGIIIVILFNLYMIHLHNEDYQKKKQVYENDCLRVQRETQQYYQNVAKYDAQLKTFNSEVQQRINQINTYRYNIETMLKNAYNLNIIPKQFRDIYGVTYLYDFISTSGSSGLGLSDAIINCNLEQIKDKLDEIINKCDDIIRQQKNTNSNLREIQRQNNQLLSESKNISNNMTLAKQYAEISAENSAVALELQKKQLAYQEVDFWLNKI